MHLFKCSDAGFFFNLFFIKLSLEKKDVMKKYMLLMVAITFSQHCHAVLWGDGGYLGNYNTTDSNDEKAYTEAIRAYQDWIITFGTQAHQHSLSPDKYQPISHARFFIEWYKILQTYCKKTIPSVIHRDEDAESKCAIKFAQKIQADPRFIPEGKRLLLSIFQITDFVPLSAELITSIIEEKE